MLLLLLLLLLSQSLAASCITHLVLLLWVSSETVWVRWGQQWSERSACRTLHIYLPSLSAYTYTCFEVWSTWESVSIDVHTILSKWVVKMKELIGYDNLASQTSINFFRGVGIEKSRKKSVATSRCQVDSRVDYFDHLENFETWCQVLLSGHCLNLDLEGNERWVLLNQKSKLNHESITLTTSERRFFGVPKNPMDGPESWSMWSMDVKFGGAGDRNCLTVILVIRRSPNSNFQVIII